MLTVASDTIHPFMRCAGRNISPISHVSIAHGANFSIEERLHTKNVPCDSEPSKLQSSRRRFRHPHSLPRIFRGSPMIKSAWVTCRRCCLHKTRWWMMKIVLSNAHTMSRKTCQEPAWYKRKRNRNQSGHQWTRSWRKRGLQLKKRKR